ncbi:MAG: sensor histidine kinase [Calditrichaeota bacterium]|nr:MAG: sensor histidine kinase [Calditrichota bacterium]MBL1207180.1 sensor histidine kinase [Calditrichota bacterium]NOG47013.1 sensor histidine kinase [Calditrichota bacterium]
MSPFNILSIENKYKLLILALIAGISVLHFNTDTMKWQYHLVYMQAYFIPIILGAFVLGKKGGLGTALIVSIVYLPHIMFQHGGLVENNFMRFLQIVLFNAVGYLTGLKAQGERTEKEKYQIAAENLEKSLAQLKTQSDQISEMEEQARATDRLAIVGELTASLAHEVRNPLGSIRGAVEIIRDSVPADIKKMEFFDILIQDTERLNQVVETYLGFSKKQSQQFSTYSLNETIQNIALMIGAQARKNKIRLKTDIPEKTITLKGDPNHVWQITMNVLLNSIQAMPDGGEIAVILSPDKISKNKIQLIIKDQGKGIPDVKINQIFKAFYTTKSKGTGLGLAIVKRIADENNWHIYVNSKEGVGTEFAIVIPLNGSDTQLS